jgi:hypothetical protein
MNVQLEEPAADGTENSAELKRHINSRMRLDYPTRVAVPHQLIVKQGNMLLHKLEHKRETDIPARMHELARLLIRCE